MKISSNLAVAMENADPSGLNEDDLKIYNSIDFDFHVIDWNEDSYDINGVCELSGLHDHCVEIEIIEHN